jgi:hypothetical protein
MIIADDYGGKWDGLYEKYGCEYRTQMNDMNGELSRVYVKKIE